MNFLLGEDFIKNRENKLSPQSLLEIELETKWCLLVLFKKIKALNFATIWPLGWINVEQAFDELFGVAVVELGREDDMVCIDLHISIEHMVALHGQNLVGDHAKRPPVARLANRRLIIDQTGQFC